MEDLDRLIALVQVPTGDDATLRLREQYTKALLSRGEEAERRIAQLVEPGTATNMPALIELLSAFESERAARVLQQKLEAGPEPIAEAAADALASHPTRWALDALYRSLQSGKPQVVALALTALRRVDQRVPCEIIVPLLRNANRPIRFHALHLAADAGCLRDETVRELLGAETDAEIRAFLSTLPGGKGMR